jgi:hypothetical protein
MLLAFHQHNHYTESQTIYISRHQHHIQCAILIISCGLGSGGIGTAAVATPGDITAAHYLDL